MWILQYLGVSKGLFPHSAKRNNKLQEQWWGEHCAVWNRNDPGLAVMFVRTSTLSCSSPKQKGEIFWQHHYVPTACPHCSTFAHSCLFLEMKSFLERTRKCICFLVFLFVLTKHTVAKLWFLHSDRCTTTCIEVNFWIFQSRKNTSLSCWEQSCILLITVTSHSDHFQRE